MNKKHVTSLELSKKLKAIGVPQDSEFYWHEREDIEGGYELEYGENHSARISAYLSSELGELLPVFVVIPHHNEDITEHRIKAFPDVKKGTQEYDDLIMEWGWISTSKNTDGDYTCSISQEDADFYHHDITESSKPDAEGKMVDYLVEQGLITF